jgi:hypothetical protein
VRKAILASFSANGHDGTAKKYTTNKQTEKERTKTKKKKIKIEKTR